MAHEILKLPDFLVEIEAIAVLDSKGDNILPRIATQPLSVRCIFEMGSKRWQ